MPVAPLVGAGIVTGIGALAGGALQAHAAGEASKTQTTAANAAAELQAKAAEQALQFQREQAALAQQNYMGTQTYNRGIAAQHYADLSPYRTAGTGSLFQLGQPIPGGGQ